MNIQSSLYIDLAHVGDFLPTPGGDIGTIQGPANVKNALLHRLLTIPGTLIHRPSYGCGLLAYQNAPNSFAVTQKLAQIIQEQFELDPRVDEVLSVSINFTDSKPEQTTIAVFVKIVGFTDAQQMTFIPFSGGIGL